MRERALRSVIVLLLVALAAVVGDARAGEPREPVVRGDWSLVWRDEFDGSRLASSRWHTCYWWAVESGARGCTIASNDELQWYVPEQVRVRRGTLRLRAERRRENGFRFASGVVTSYERFSFRYGYVEARLRVPKGRGLWPAFWLLPEDRDWPPEIDVVEIRGDRPARAHHTLHYVESRRHRASSGSWRGPDFSREWHVFAVDWRPNRIVWYVDGVERHRVTAHVPAKRMHLIANLAVGGGWPGAPTASTRFPAELEIDWLRVWQDARVAKSQRRVGLASATSARRSRLA